MSEPIVRGIVKLPNVVLKVADVSCLKDIQMGTARNLAIDSCYRLRQLGLVTKFKGKPTGKLLKELTAKYAEARKLAAKQLREQNWRDLDSHCYTLKSLKESLGGVERWLITPFGEKLLRNGEVNVTTEKVAEPSKLASGEAVPNAL